jgi:hypothetical protein
MDDNQNKRRGPFSQLQAGCALMMMVNLLIYLGVIAFAFNMLDPSKLSPNYLARRGFLVDNVLDSEARRAMDRIIDQKLKEQAQLYKNRKEVFEPSAIFSAQDLRSQIRLSAGWNQRLSIPSILSDATKSIEGTVGRGYRQEAFVQIYPDKIDGLVDFDFDRSLPYKTILPSRTFKTISVQTAPLQSVEPFKVHIPGNELDQTYSPQSPVSHTPKRSEKMVPATNTPPKPPTEEVTKDTL